MPTRETYQLQSLQGLVFKLNRAMADIADRLDRAEGVRGSPTLKASLNMDDNEISGASSVAAGSFSVTDEFGTKIHSME